jgi:phage shock protein PspC (stress-responsive transcriptional regulator)
MQTNGNLFTRDDTFFGVCQGLGEDTGIPPNLLRLGLAFTLFWNPLAAVGGYAALGIVVGLSRFLFPAMRAGETTAAAAAADPAMAGSQAGAAEPADAEQARAEPERLAA